MQISNQSFSIGFSAEDNTRRQAYFRNKSGQLTDQERAVLNALGIDSILEESLKPHLAEFFQKLAICNGDISLLLRKQCEVPYFVVWSALFANRKETQRRLNENKKKHSSMMDITDAMTSALIKNLGKKKQADSFDDIFTLITLQTIPAKGSEKPTTGASAKTTKSAAVAVDEIFTLITL